MMEPSTELRADLERNRRWRDSNGAEGCPVYLAFESLPGLKLTDAVLWEATLQEADLRDGDLRRVTASASRANGLVVAGADLTASTWTRAELVEADFTGADLTDAVLIRAVLDRANFDGARLTRANLRGSVCTGARFRGATLVGTNLTGVLLARADLSTADVTDAVLDGCLIERSTVLTDLRGLDRASVSHLFTTDGRLDGEDARAFLEELAGEPRR